MIAASAPKLSLGNLPGRPMAEEYIAKALRSGLPLCPVALTVDVYPTITDHFGPAGGDAALAAVARALPAAQLFRWTGATLVVMLDTLDAACLLLGGLPDLYSVKSGDGTDLIGVPFSVRTGAFPARLSDSAADLARRIDRWVAAPYSRCAPPVTSALS